MKLLLDTCIWGGAVKTLIECGYDVIWSGDWQVDPGDTEILAYAYQQQRILSTLDFEGLAFWQHRDALRNEAHPTLAHPTRAWLCNKISAVDRLVWPTYIHTK